MHTYREQEGRVLGTRMELRKRRRADTSRVIRVAISSALTALLVVGYAVGDLTDVFPGVLTLRDVANPSYAAPLSARTATAIAGTANRSKTVDAAAAQQLIDAFAADPSVGTDFSIVIATADGTVVASHEPDAQREPASTMKTLTALAAASVLDMGSTLATSAYLSQASGQTPTLYLKGSGDMLLGSGDNDPNHINGRAGLGTLAKTTATSLKQRGITSVAVRYDDTVFADPRYPATIAQNNPSNMYYTAVSSMAVDGGRQWTADQQHDPDLFTSYPVLSMTPAADAAVTFAQRLTEQGITVDGSPVAASVPSGLHAVATVQSATLAEIMAFTLRHSDNTLAEEFGRLLANATGNDNSPTGATTAVKQELDKLGVSTSGLVMADCSGLSDGSRLTATTLVQVQERNLRVGGAVAAAEGLSVPGLVGTAKSRLADQALAGQLRVKTGSLKGVTSMAGNVSRTNGGLVSFAVIVNNPTNLYSARIAINKFMSALAGL